MKNAAYFFMLGLLFFSCKNEAEKFKDITEPEIQQIKKSMLIIIDVLEKSDFDTISIRNYWIESEVYMDSLYSAVPNVNMDSIREEVVRNFDLKDYSPFSKQISFSSDGSIYMNNRGFFSNIDNQKDKIINCYELRNISLKEKQNFIQSLLFLRSYHIWNASEEFGLSKNVYSFWLSSENLSISSDLDYYIYFANDYNNVMNNKSKYLFQKSGLVVCRGR